MRSRTWNLHCSLSYFFFYKVLLCILIYTFVAKLSSGIIWGKHFCLTQTLFVWFTPLHHVHRGVQFTTTFPLILCARAVSRPLLNLTWREFYSEVPLSFTQLSPNSVPRLLFPIWRHGIQLTAAFIARLKGLSWSAHLSCMWKHMHIAVHSLYIWLGKECLVDLYKFENWGKFRRHKFWYLVIAVLLMYQNMFCPLLSIGDLCHCVNSNKMCQKSMISMGI